MKFRLFLLLLCPLLSTCYFAPGPDVQVKSAEIKKPLKVETRLDTFAREYARYFEEQFRLTNTPGAALVIVKDNQILFIKGYGPRVYGQPDSIDENTVFRIGSLSKGFAGVLTGLLVQDSVLRWTDRVQEYYPEFVLRDRKQASRVELWHLLSHTTGLPYHAFTNLIEKDFSVDRIVREYFPTAPVSGKEGEFYAYQNAALCIIEQVMQQKTGKSYAQLLAEEIFLPLGMHHASCDYQSLMQEPDKTPPHVPVGWGLWRADKISPLYYNATAAGGINASISDMGQWLLMLLGQKPQVIAPSTLDQVFHPVVKTDKERRIFPRWLPRDAASYAMGWRVLDDHGDTIIYHGGYVNGYKSEIAFNRKDGIGICALFNAATPLSNDCVPAFFEQWKGMK
ncbi:MAG TPA: serine hydrolase domain-containing protein [Saprospiraceae bacterium]|nr:serine hydrolase domain-containing protein [Saprospiraceae bacterium]